MLTQQIEQKAEYILDREPIKTQKVSRSFHPNPEMSSQSSDFGGSISTSTSTCYSHPHYRSTAHPMQTLVPGPCPCGFADYFSTSHSSGSKIKSHTVKEIHFGHTKNTISTHSSSEESPTISYRL